MKAAAAVAWYAIPFVYQLTMAAFLAPSALAQTNLPEENRRIIDAEVQRLNSTQNIHDRDVETLKDDLYRQNRVIERRLDTIEKYLFYLFVGSGGTIGVVGIDKATYWVKKNKATT